VLPAQRRLRTWWRETDARRGGPARPYSVFTAAASGYHQAGAVGARSCGRPQVRSPGGSRAPRRRCAAPPSDRECAARLASVGRAGPSAPPLLPGCSPGAPAPPAAAARPASARSPAGAEGRTGTAHRLGIGAHGFPGPLLAPAACSALASASYVPLWWRRAARDRVAEFARWKWNEPGGNVAPSGRSDENVCVSHGIACFSFLLLFWVLTLSE